MSYENWKNKAQGFQTVDVRHIQGSFFEGVKKRAEALEVGEGLHIIQTFEPHPLYAVMEGLGYEHHPQALIGEKPPERCSGGQFCIPPRGCKRNGTVFEHFLLFSFDLFCQSV